MIELKSGLEEEYLKVACPDCSSGPNEYCSTINWSNRIRLRFGGFHEGRRKHYFDLKQRKLLK